MIKKYLAVIGKTLGIVLASITLGFLLLVGVYSLPTTRLVRNVENSTSLFVDGENKIRNWVGDLRYGKIDYSTDATMIKTALCREYDSSIYNALLNPEWKGEEDNGFSFAFSSEEATRIDTYGRYWHGYLLYLIPALNFFSYGGIRVIMMAVQLLLIIGLIILIYERKKQFVISYLAFIFFINPITTILNMQNATIFILTLISCIVIILLNNKLLENYRYVYYFALLGVLTVYFDFLTYPLVTWGVSIINLLLFTDIDVKEKFKLIITTGLAWIIGYAGMWVGKWILGTLLTNVNVIEDAMANILFRSGVSDSVSEDLSFGFAIKNAIISFKDPQMVAIGLLLILLILIQVKVEKRKFKFNKNTILDYLPYLLIWISPYAWAFVVRNHFITHQFLEYRTLGIAVLVKYILISKLFVREEVND